MAYAPFNLPVAEALGILPLQTETIPSGRICLLHLKNMSHPYGMGAAKAFALRRNHCAPVKDFNGMEKSIYS